MKLLILIGALVVVCLLAAGVYYLSTNVTLIGKAKRK